MNKKQDPVDSLIERLKEQRPQAADEQRLTERIMQQIQQNNTAKPSMVWLWMRRVSAVAAAILLLLLVFQETTVSEAPDTGGQFVQIENPKLNRCKAGNEDNVALYQCYMKTKREEKEIVNNLINKSTYENND